MRSTARSLSSRFRSSQAAGEGASVVVFPEAFISGYPDWVWTVPPANKALINELYKELLASAVTIPDESTDRLCKAAKEAGVYLAVGVNERNSEASNSSLYNTLLYITQTEAFSENIAS